MLRDENEKEKLLLLIMHKNFWVVGDKLMGLVLKNNWKAIILNGYVRDTDETKNIDVGLFCNWDLSILEIFENWLL